MWKWKVDGSTSSNSSSKHKLYNYLMTLVAQRFALCVLDVEIPSSIPGRTNLGNELFQIVSGLGLLGSVSELTPLLWYL